MNTIISLIIPFQNHYTHKKNQMKIITTPTTSITQLKTIPSPTKTSNFLSTHPLKTPDTTSHQHCPSARCKKAHLGAVSIHGQQKQEPVAGVTAITFSGRARAKTQSRFVKMRLRLSRFLPTRNDNATCIMHALQIADSARIIGRCDIS